MNLKSLINSGLLKPGVKIKPLMPNTQINATININGELIFDKYKFINLDEAMSKVVDPMLYSQSTSTGWQFWGVFDSENNLWVPLEHLRAKFNTLSQSHKVRTSYTHPLRIDLIQLPNRSGVLGMTFCPGKKISGLYSGTWNRDLEIDLASIQQSGASTLISLMEDHEFTILGVPNFKQRLKASSLNWIQLSIQDSGVPGIIFEQKWQKVAVDIHQRLKNNELIVIHCRGGLGRTGLLAARLLVETGFTPVEAVSKIRSTRSRTIETFSQEYYILTQAWKN